MKIFLLGATGKTGTEILRKLINDKYEVKVLVRDPAKFNSEEFQQTGQIEVAQGEVLEPNSLVDYLKGCDMVISALGTGQTNRYTELYSEGGRNILAAMRTNGIKRLVTITSGSVDMSDPSTDNFFMNRVIRPNFNKVYYDMTRWETILNDTRDIDWICVRPTYLRDKPFTGKYRVSRDHCPTGGPKIPKIGRADLADFIVKQLSSDKYIHQKPVIAY